MTAIELYKFIHQNDVEFKWENNKDQRDILIFVTVYDIQEFNDLLTQTAFDDYGIECTMMKGHFAFWMDDICQHYGIDLVEVFGKDEEH